MKIARADLGPQSTLASVESMNSLTKSVFGEKREQPDSIVNSLSNEIS